MLRIKQTSVVAVATLALAAGCSQGQDSTPSGEETVRSASQALTAAQAAVLGFENPTASWSSSVSIASSSTAYSGSAAMSVAANGWTEIVSTPLSSLGTINSTASLAVRIPQAASWGEVRVVLEAPSVGLYRQDIGGQTLVGMTPSIYHRLSYSVPSSIVSALSGSYSDLRIRVIVNGPSMPGGYLIDDFVIADTSSGGGGTGGSGGGGAGSAGSGSSTKVKFTVVAPQGVPPANAFMSATERLQIDDRVELSESPKIETVSSLGSFELGANVLAHANVWGGVIDNYMRSNAHVFGFVRTVTNLRTQDPVYVDRGRRERASWMTVTSSWDVDWAPGSSQIWLDVDGSMPVAPGSYTTFNLQPRAKAYLRSGTYYLDSFNTEPEAQVHLDMSAGPVVIYVKNSLTYKGAFVTDAGDASKLFVGYAGTGIAFMQAPFVGGLVAPNGTIELQQPTSLQHKGAFFGKVVHVFSDAKIGYAPITIPLPPDPPAPACPLGDRDGDGTNDCDDRCPSNSAKTHPGVCGCSTIDRSIDGDDIPECVDGCTLNGNTQRNGQCGCGIAEAQARLGMACTDGLCPGKNTCDGNGQCGNPEACSPVPGQCKVFTYGASTYWVCDAAKSWVEAKALCETSPGRSLARVDVTTENALVAHVMAATPTITSAWTGGADPSNTGTWSWVPVRGLLAQTFWQGGKRVLGQYANWSGGAPVGSGGCVLLANKTAGSQWTATPCGDTHAFVCESPSPDSRIDIPEPPKRACETQPGGCEPPIKPCVDPSTIGLPSGVLSEAEINAQRAACQDACQLGQDDPTNPAGCDCSDATKPCAACTGLAAIPADGTCSPFDNQKRCTTIASSSGKPCATDGECDTANGEICGALSPCKACDDGDGDEDCNSTMDSCRSQYFCGKPHASCGWDDPSDPNPNRCGEVELCVETVEQDADPATTIGHDLSAVPNPETQVPPVAEPVPPTYDIEPACSGGGTCPKQGKDHPWCKYNAIEDEAPAANAPVSKHGKSHGSSVKFDFDPDLTLDFNVDPKPLGEAGFNLRAKASFLAKVDFDIKGMKGHFDVVNLAAGIAANRCLVDTRDTHLTVLGHDFAPNELKFTSDSIFSEAACKKAFDDYATALNRAKKSLRDAEELIRQYNANKLDPANIRRFADNFCDTVAGDPAEGFTKRACSAEAYPEDTINRFIDFYHNQAAKAGDALNELATKTLSLDMPAAVDKDLGSSNEEVTLLSVPFAIGPIPCVLELSSKIGYGLRGGFGYSVTPGSILVSTGGKSRLASVTAHVTPYAMAQVGLFVGAGFNWGGASVTAGLAGDITLASLAFPLHAGVGIYGETVKDERVLTGDRATMTDGTVLVGGAGLDFYRYRFSAGLTYGAAAEINNILSGTISARVRLKFFFFSKTWKATLMRFTGRSLGSITIVGNNLGNDPSGTPVIGDHMPEVFLGQAKMPFPFLHLNRLPRDPSQMRGAATPVNDFNANQVEELFYDGLCTCKKANESCYRNADCCDDTGTPMSCFEDNSSGALSGTKYCRACGKPGNACNVDSDCCAGACLQNAAGVKTCGCKSNFTSCKSTADCCENVDGTSIPWDEMLCEDVYWNSTGTICNGQMIML